MVLILDGAAGMPRTATATADGVTRVTIEVPGAAAPPADTGVAAPLTPPVVSDGRPVTTRRHFALVAIDPGHGGDDVGVHTADGLQEKELTLDVARRVRQRLETRLGVRVILTRDDDRALPLDERAAFANNSKADLFLSLHANGALGPGIAGAEVYFLSLDQEGERVRRRATAEALSLPALGGGRRIARGRAMEPGAGSAYRQVGLACRDARRGTAAAGADEPAGRAAGRHAGADRSEHAGGAGRDGLSHQRRTGSKARSDDFRNGVADAVYEAVARFRTYADEADAVKLAPVKPTPVKPAQ